MKEVLIWLIIFWTVFGIFNVSIRWYFEKYKASKFVGRALYFLISLIFAYFIYHQYTIYFSYQLITALLITNFIALGLLSKTAYYSSILKDRYFLLFQTFNVGFQQVMALSGIYLLKDYFSISYKDYYFGLLFLFLHLPVLFFPWAKLKTIIVIYSFLAGTISSYLVSNFNYGFMFSFLIHFLVYIFAIYYTRDEEKI